MRSTGRVLGTAATAAAARVAGERMDDERLQPETLLDLQIQLDHLNRMAEQCRETLRMMRSGRLDRSAYLDVLECQVSAQRQWEAKNRRYFHVRDEA